MKWWTGYFFIVSLHCVYGSELCLFKSVTCFNERWSDFIMYLHDYFNFYYFSDITTVTAQGHQQYLVKNTATKVIAHKVVQYI